LAISATRAPANPLAENSSVAASRMRAFVRSGSRCRAFGAGVRRFVVMPAFCHLPEELNHSSG
jgi:hypothetical protein